MIQISEQDVSRAGGVPACFPAERGWKQPSSCFAKRTHTSHLIWNAEGHMHIYKVGKEVASQIFCYACQIMPVMKRACPVGSVFSNKAKVFLCVSCARGRNVQKQGSFCEKPLEENRFYSPYTLREEMCCARNFTVHLPWASVSGKNNLINIPSPYVARK